MSWSSCDTLLETRSGMAYVTGTLLVPSQFRDHDPTRLGKVPNRGLKVETFEDLEIATFFPDGSRNYTSCVLFHNPNAATVCDFIDPKSGTLWGVPGQLLRLLKVPIVM